jgi:gliding motility-associated-like protein
MSIGKAIEITTMDCNCKILLSNIFTPKNGEYVYLPEITQELHSFSMVIYDRWGNVMFRTKEFRAWDGKTNGRDAVAGVYYCVVEYSCKDNPTKKHYTQSSITLVR